MKDQLSTLKAAVICFAGPKGTGKDTTARALWGGTPSAPEQAGPWREAWAVGAYRVDKCAAALYRMVAELTGWTVEQLEGPLKEAIWTDANAPTPTLIGWSPRKLLEQLGSNFVRDKIGRDHWVQLLKARLNKHTSGITVITDCRFENEARVADLVIELRRPGKDYDERPDSEGGHESRRRLPHDIIDGTIFLTPDMDYHTLAEGLLHSLDIVRRYGRRAARLRQAAWDAAGKPAMVAPHPESTLGQHLTDDDDAGSQGDESGEGL